MISYYKKPFTFILAIVLLNSCVNLSSPISPTPTKTSQPTSTETSKDLEWINNLLKESSCLPPCWAGIIPSKSTYSQAVEALQQNPHIMSIQKYQSRIGWYFGPKVGSGRGYATTAEFFREPASNKYATPDPNLVIQEISISPPWGQLSVERITDFYGVPEKVLFHDWIAGTVGIDLLYPKLGMVVHLVLENQYTDPSEVKATINRETNIIRILFYEPELSFFFSETNIQKPLKEFDWKGYTTYQ